MSNPSEAQIRIRAYQLWQIAGEPNGQNDDFWFQAQKELSEVHFNQGEVLPGLTDNLPV